MSKYVYGPLMEKVSPFKKCLDTGPVRLGVNDPHDKKGAGRGMIG